MVTGFEIRMRGSCIISPARKTDAPVGAAVLNKPHMGRRFLREVVILCVLTVTVVSQGDTRRDSAFGRTGRDNEVVVGALAPYLKTSPPTCRRVRAIARPGRHFSFC